MPDFAEGGLAGFQAEAGRFEDGDSGVVVACGDIAFVHAVEGEVVDLFIGHDDLVAFVADAEEGMGAGVEDDAAHQSFGLFAGGTERLKLFAVSVFINIEESGFVFFG